MPITDPSELDAAPTDAPVTDPSASDPGTSDTPMDPTAFARLVAPDAPADPSLFAQRVNSTPGEPASQPAPTAVKGAVDFKGSTAHGRAVAGGLYGKADAASADYAAADAARASKDQATMQADYAGVKGATEEEKTATQEYLRIDGEYQTRLADLQKGYADMEAKMASEAKAERASYMATYKEQLAGVQALAAQTGNPYNTMSKGAAVGLIGAQFAQGFLAARGIHIDVSSQIDKWVDRSIQEHQMQVQNARQGAEDTMHLYEIARQSSQDDYEARQRYRGYAIASLQTGISANANAFQSSIAMAHADQSIAKLQVEADTTARNIGDMHEQRVTSYMKDARDAAYKQGMLSIEQIKASAEVARANAAKAAKPAPGNLNISDPEYVKGADGKELKDARGNRILVNGWRVDGTQSAEIQNKVREEAANARTNWAKYKDATDELQATYQKAEKVRKEHPNWAKMGWDTLARVDSTGAVAEFLNAQTNWVMAKVYNDSGKAVNADEFKRHQDQARADLTLELNGNEKVEKLQSRLMERGRKSFERNMEIPGLIKVEPTDSQYYDTSRTASPSVKATNDAVINGEMPVATTASGLVDLADSKSGETRKPTALWHYLVGSTNPADAPFAYDERHNAVDWLAEMMAAPDAYRKIHEEAAKGREDMSDIPNDDKELVKQAVAGMEGLAGDEKHPDIAKHATAVLNLYRSDPNKLRELVTSPSDSATPEGFPQVTHDTGIDAENKRETIHDTWQQWQQTK